jgi:ferredoxin/flavodoxin---NADP+ reductase
MHIFRYKVLSNLEVCPSHFVLSWKRDFNFVPGQIVQVTTSPDIPARMYSLASGPLEPEARILYEVVKEGRLTPRLAALRPGDQLYISQPHGNFLSDEEPAWWIAAGTGIAPFASMWYSGLGGNKVLVHGSRSLDGFVFQEAFEGSMGNRYVRCCSSQSGEGIYHGRLTTWLTEQEHLPMNMRYLLCGSAEMVVKTRDILIGRGVPYEMIMAEIYF